MKSVKNIENQEKGVVLKKALLNVIRNWEISQTEVSDILGISPSTISRIINNESTQIVPKSNEGEKALYFIRVFRSLDSFMGNDYEEQRKWLKAKNKFFNNSPLKTMKTMEGLVRVVNYLDAMRGQY